jgi:glyoxylase-like metal-dependent hydrolase (beta-lactamase superfamily II)
MWGKSCAENCVPAPDCPQLHGRVVHPHKMAKTLTGALPHGVTVLERGWLSANNILFSGHAATALVDSGYETHAEQTLSLIARALKGRPLDLLLNTHLHSDHCGGNAALQARYPACITCIPPGHAQQVLDWDTLALSYHATGQSCPRFSFHKILRPGDIILLGDITWQIHAAPGHDPHSVILFDPASRALISADALWENGFGVVFPELAGEEGFAQVASTLDLIESLRPEVIIPGHGPVFTDIASALHGSRKRLENFVRNPARHAGHAAKVLLKYKLLEWQKVSRQALLQWAERTPYFDTIHAAHFSSQSLQSWLCEILTQLEKSGALRQRDEIVHNA